MRSIEPNPAGPLERLLRASNMVFPLLTEVNSADHAVHRIVAEIGLELLDKRLKVGGSHRSAFEEEQDRVDARREFMIVWEQMLKAEGRWSEDEGSQWAQMAMARVYRGDI
jgi:hypothetical protein